MSDVLDCPDCGGSGTSKDSPPGIELRCLLCSGQGKVGGEYGEPAEEPPPPEDVDPLDARPAWDQVGWRPPGCHTCGGSGEVISLGGQVQGGEARRGVRAPCPACSKTRSA